MKHFAVGLAAALLLSTTALAQSPPPPPTPPPPGPPGPPPRDGMRPRGGHGAFIKLKGPNGAEIAVRCADGDSTADCMDVVTQLIDKVKAMRPGRSGDDGDRRGGYRGGPERGGPDRGDPDRGGPDRGDPDRGWGGGDRYRDRF